MNTKGHILRLSYNILEFQSDLCAKCNASLAEGEEKKKEEKSSVLLPSQFALLHALVSSSTGSPKCVYTLRIPERTLLIKFCQVRCFGLSTRVTGSFPIFRLISTYEILAYFMILLLVKEVQIEFTI